MLGLRWDKEPPYQLLQETALTWYTDSTSSGIS